MCVCVCVCVCVRACVRAMYLHHRVCACVMCVCVCNTYHSHHLCCMNTAPRHVRILTRIIEGVTTSARRTRQSTAHDSTRASYRARRRVVLQTFGYRNASPDSRRCCISMPSIRCRAVWTVRRSGETMNTPTLRQLPCAASSLGLRLAYQCAPVARACSTPSSSSACWRPGSGLPAASVASRQALPCRTAQMLGSDAPSPPSAWPGRMRTTAARPPVEDPRRRARSVTRGGSACWSSAAPSFPPSSAPILGCPSVCAFARLRGRAAPGGAAAKHAARAAAARTTSPRRHQTRWSGMIAMPARAATHWHSPSPPHLLRSCRVCRCFKRKAREPG